ncbi:UNVERIFIED_CONTAM: hypothetical protein Sradi_5462300 [Sesamum radiatum]|uniref:Uncharacterized protein n=1 Tax=Sesamum radiatum TaxID=300843 RepID=A0AAW2L9I7_SESRA
MASSNVQAQQQKQQAAAWVSTVNIAPSFVPTKLWFDKKTSNYVAWKEQMLCLIESQGLLGFIDGTNKPPPPETGGKGTTSQDIDETGGDGTTSEDIENPDYVQWRRSDVLLKGWILCSLNDDVVSTVTLGLETSRDVWVELENKFRRISGVDPPQYGPEPAEEGDLKKYLPLHRAALRGNWEAVKRILDRNPNGLTKSINVYSSTALHIAVGTGKKIHFVGKIVAEMPPESLAATDEIGNTALSIAAAVGNIAAAKILVSKKPDLLYISNKYDEFPVQVAALYARKEMLEYLISVTRDDFGKNPYAELAGLSLLQFVIEADYFDIALDLLKKYPDLARLKPPDQYSALEKITLKKSVFCSERRFNIWERFIASCAPVDKTLSPQLTNGCDMESMAQNSQAAEFQSLHAMLWKFVEQLEFQSLHAMLWKFVEQLGVIKSIKEKSLLKRQALQLVKRLCKEIELLSFDEAKDIYFDAIMLAAELGIHEVVEEIVETFPSAFYFKMAGSRQNILHVAVINRSEHVYNLIYQMTDHKYLCADLVDSDDNSLLHFAGQLAPAHNMNEISGAALQMQRELQWYKRIVEKILDIFEQHSRVLKAS